MDNASVAMPANHQCLAFFCNIAINNSRIADNIGVIVIFFAVGIISKKADF